MILIVGLNLSIDRIVAVDHLVPGEVHRATSSEPQAGGKGVNVARMLKALDEPFELIGLIAGRTGDDIEAQLEREGIKSSLVRTSGESRTNYIIDSDDRQTVINENGAPVGTESIEELIVLFSDRIRNSDVVILTGSVQPGVDPALYHRLIQTANQAGKQTVLDAVGACLTEGLSAAPTVAKPNHHEAATISKRPVNSESEAVDAARMMISLGAKNAAITMGKQGMVVVSPDDAWIVRSPTVDVVNVVGSGDAATAGFATGLCRKLSLIESAILAVACGTASVKHGFGRCTPGEVEEIKQRIKIHSL